MGVGRSSRRQPRSESALHAVEQDPGPVLARHRQIGAAITIEIAGPNLEAGADLSLVDGVAREAPGGVERVCIQARSVLATRVVAAVRTDALAGNDLVAAISVQVSEQERVRLGP